MRHLIAFYVLFFTCSTSFGQIDSSTEILIIGTIHTGNKKFNHKALLEVLRTNKPDVILWEQSIKFKRVLGLQTASFLKIWKPGIEQLALQAYSKQNRSTLILPYDTAFLRRQYISEASAVKRSFYDMLHKARKSTTDSILYAEFDYRQEVYYSSIDTLTLTEINQKDIVDKSRDLYNLEEMLILPMGKKYVTDTLAIAKFSNEVLFWKERNEYMAGQIMGYLKHFACKKIIVLTGLNHKYYLLDKLNDLSNRRIRIIEFSE